MDYVKMEAEYNCSKEVGNKKIIFKFKTGLQVLFKPKKGLESENADMNRDVEVEYRDILK